VTLKSASGNPDLFGEKFYAPNVNGRDCPSCTLCRSRTAGYENCIVTSGTTSFYVMIYAFDYYTDGELKIEGSNLVGVVRADFL